MKAIRITIISLLSFTLLVVTHYAGAQTSTKDNTEANSSVIGPNNQKAPDGAQHHEDMIINKSENKNGPHMPVYHDTGNPQKDQASYYAAYKEWIMKYPGEYQAVREKEKRVKAYQEQQKK